MGTLKKILRKIAKWIGILLLSIIGLLIIVIILIRTPWAQQKITDYAISYASKKTSTRVDIQKLFITFSGNVQLEGLYVEDQKNDTLVYSRSLEAGLGLRSLFHGTISISKVDWQGLRAHVKRGADSTFNFDFIIDAFAGNKESTTDSEPKDTSSSSTRIVLGPIDFSDFRLAYLDSITGIDAKLNLGKLEVTTDDLDLEKSRFEIDEIHLANTSAEVFQFLSPPSSADTSSSATPYLSVDELTLENVNLHYTTLSDTLEAKAAIGNFTIDDARLDLSRQKIDINSIALRQSDLQLHLPAAKIDTTQIKAASDTAAPISFTWPDWQIALDELNFEKDNIGLNQGNSIPKEGVFDPSHLAFHDLDIDLQNAELKDQKITLELNNLAFAERSGFQLQKLAFDAELSDTKTDIEDLTLQTGHSRLNTSLKVLYKNIDSLLTHPLQNALVNLNIDETSLSVKDAYYFADSLRYDSLIQQIEPYPLQLQGSVKGKYADLQISQLEADWLNNTSVVLNGHIKGLPDTNALQVNTQLTANSTGKDLSIIANPGSGTYPERVHLESSIQGNARKLTAKLTVNTPDGNIDFHSKLENLMQDPAFNGKLKVASLDVGKITGNPELEPISLSLDFDGKGKSLPTLELHSNIDFKKLNFKNYDYSHLKIAANVKDQKAQLTLQHKDENLDFTCAVNALLDTAKTMADLHLNLNGADLHDLNFTSGNLKVAAQLNGSFEGSGRAFKAKLNLTKTVFVENDDNYHLDSLYAGLTSDSTQTDLQVNSDILKGELQANVSLQKLSSALNEYLTNLLSLDSMKTATTNDSLDMKGHFIVADSPLLDEILLPKLNEIDTARLALQFKPSADILNLDLNAPKIIYGDSQLDDLQLHLSGGNDSTKLALGFSHLQSGPVDMHQTRLNIDLSGKNGYAYFKVLDTEQKQVFYASLDIDRYQKYTLLHVNPDHLVLHYNNWNIPASNKIELYSDKTIFHDFNLSYGNQQLSLESNEKEQQMLLAFQGFKLDAIFSILNPESSPVAGDLNGHVNFTNLDKTPAFVADISLNNLEVLNNPIGTLTLKANNSTSDKYEVNLTLKGENIDLGIAGDYSTTGRTQNLDFKVNLDKLNLVLAQAFIPDQIEDASGSMAGHFNVNGPADNIQYKGKLSFNNAHLTPKLLGTSFALPNEEINIDNDGLTFHHFTLVDANTHKTDIDGTIGTKNMLNPTFNLNITADQFQVLNSTEKDNDLYYGKALLDLNVDVSGDLDLPVVKARLKLDRGTDITYVVPATQAQIREREGIVRFRNVQDTNTILNEEETSSTVIKGFDVDAYITIAPETKFTIIVDPQSGDKLTMAGQADLNFSMSPNGNINLSGAYELSDGGYKLSLYDLVKKEFKIIKGSRIEWSGDPMGASLDITAEYDVEAAPSDLMADQLTAESNNSSMINRYSQKLPFEVMLYINGDLNNPKISFGLDMPDNSRNALGGSVYTRVQRLNEDEAQLNQQVFSLIVFGKFLPSDVASANTGGTSQLARSSVSKLLSSQLNKLSSKYVKGVQLNFDVNSYTDYQTGGPQDRTDLNVSLKKAFLDNRVIIEVGSQVGVEGPQQSNDVVGDVSVEYLLTENGHYRLRAFRKNQYQDLVEGQVTITGLAILFSKEFDTWREMISNSDKKDSKQKKENSNDKATKNDSKDSD